MANGRYVMNTPITLSVLASGLEKVKWHGDHNFSACCPAHNDRNPSFSVSDVNGKTLVKCFSGCTQEGVINALRDLGLWHSASRDQIDRRNRSELKESIRHHQQILWLGVAQAKTGQELSELDQAQIKKSIVFLKEFANG